MTGVEPHITTENQNGGESLHFQRHNLHGGQEESAACALAALGSQNRSRGAHEPKP